MIESQIQKCIVEMKNGNVPTIWPEIPNFYIPDDIKFYEYRRKVCFEYGMFAMVDMSWTAELAKWIGNRTCLEIMAGAGWLSKALHNHGVEIIATDDYSWFDGHKKINHVFNVQNMNAIDAINTFDADILIISWPPYDKPDAYKAMVEWGDKLPIVYIGEDCGGCTADDDFHNHFVKYDINFYMPQWNYIHDYVFIGRYESCTR
jgi:hypothetical protein